MEGTRNGAPRIMSAIVYFSSWLGLNSLGGRLTSMLLPVSGGVVS
jgi:hypothetical protein